MEVLIYQTGKARDVASSDPAVLNKETIFGTFKHRYLPHIVEAEYEAKDFAKYAREPKFNLLLADFTMYVSVGSTSTQGWIRNSKMGGVNYQVVIPPPNTTVFQTIGAKMSKGNPTPLIQIIESHLSESPTNKVLFFNAMGYTVDPDVIQERNEMLASALKQYDIGSVIRSLPVCLTEPSFVDNFLLNSLKQSTLKDRMFVFPKLTSLNFASSWCSVLAMELKKFMIDMGGGAVYLYYPNGTKVEAKVDMDPNSQLLPEVDEKGNPIRPKKTYPIMYPNGTTLENVTERSVSLFTPEILQSIVAKLQTAGRRRRTRRATRKRRTRK
jgi:hypothetical protein